METNLNFPVTRHKSQDTSISREKGYKKLILWRKADDLAFKTYLKTKQFPKDELYGITNQLRRAVLSVPTNISEGMGRQGRNETRQFLNIALGSLGETEYLLDFCYRMKFMNENEYNKLESLRSEVGAMLWTIYKKYQ
jgi:four helix bundle protein